MENHLSETISNFILKLRQEPVLSKNFSEAENIFQDGNCLTLTQSNNIFEFLISQKDREESVTLHISEHAVHPLLKNKPTEWNVFSLSALLKLQHAVSSKTRHFDHKKYTREGMMHRVLEERKSKALKEEYRIRWADNIYGEHNVVTPQSKAYKVFLRDFEQETGYSNSPDARHNKLGTTKHIMAAFNQLKASKQLWDRLKKTFPFVEIYLDPLHDYRITWHYPHTLPENVAPLIYKYFGDENHLEDVVIKDFLGFIEEAASHDIIKIRPEVQEKIDDAYEQDMLLWIKENYEVPFDRIKADLYPYQKEGVSFISYRKGSILADEMGLGKTLQAIAASLAKKSIFSFRKTLIVCPASLKDQWKREIERFTDETALIVQGTPEERAEQYRKWESYFLITNYEAVLRDSGAINKAGVDFLILDEAQRIKNFETKTASSIGRIAKKHVLVLTGTPIENRLSDLYSIMQVVDSELLGPLWEFSYQHCLFDHEKPNKINAYYDLQKLKKKIAPVVLRREKRKVISQMANLSQVDVAVELGPLQQEYHAGYAKGVSKIIRKKFLTPADMTRLMQLLSAMRMLCDSTYLIDDETNESPKLVELEHILIEKLDLKNSEKKIIIFSEWVKCHKLIGEMLRKHDITFTEFAGSVAVKKRGALIKKFEDDKNCKVFLSTEAGGAGLNLQVADTLINFELPWNPAKKNQRIGRIDRLGQKNKHLTVINFITKGSIETRIASGLLIKQNLFEGVLNESHTTNLVDFSEKGRPQFLEELESMLSSFEIPSEEHAETSEPELVFEEENDIAEALNQQEPETTDVSQPNEQPLQADTEQLQEVMNQGMGFLSGLFKMATGNDLGTENQSIEVNKETGEVTMKFKLPGFGTK